MPMGIGQYVPNAATRTVVCFDRMVNGEIFGRIYHPFSDDPPDFAGVVQLANRMEKLFDRLSYPQAGFQMRSFRPGGTGEQDQREGAERPMEQKMMRDVHGDTATFIVRVQFRQNATWQGTVDWTEERKSQRFRSVLELIKLMSDAFPEEEDQTLADWSNSAEENK